MPPIDITLICGRRPELLAITLQSFSDHLFCNFKIDRFIANLDPFAGNDDAHSECRRLITERFKDAVIIEPSKPSFGMAVKQAWSNSSAEFIFHMEDDWVLDEAVNPGDVFPFLNGKVKALQLASEEIRAGDSPFKVHRKKRRFLGIPLGYKLISIFGTSPGFWDGAVARTCASLMDPNLDPEKQMRPPFNPPLSKFLGQYRCRLLHSKSGGNLIRDIGREWRMNRGITKTVMDGRSVWVNHDS